MAKKNTPLGAQSVDDPDTQVVQDPVANLPPEPEPPAPDTTPSGLVIPSEAGPDLSQPPVQDPVPEEPPVPETVPDATGHSVPEDALTTVLLEDGSRVLMLGYNLPPSRRITDLEDRNYEHVADDPVTGEWIYRHM